MTLAFGVERHQPTRAEMRKLLTNVEKAAALLHKALSEPSISEFLEPDSSSGVSRFNGLIGPLADVCACAKAASTSANLVNSKGKTAPGQGRASPASAISAQTYCAILIAETYKWFRGKYPSPRSRDAAKAADLFWELSGGSRRSWGGDPLKAWRHHFRNASVTPAESDRAEYRRHLRESERDAGRFNSDEPSRR
jgi:hypothetical protein